MRIFITLVSFTIMASAQAGAAPGPTQLNVAFGVSVPIDSTGQTYVLPTGPSRATGGEHFVVKFNGPKMISEIKLSGFSTGKAGKTLIHSAKGVTGATTVSLDGLFQFAKVTNGNPVNFQNLVMLPDATFVQILPNQPFTQLDIVVEGFTNNDSSILLQITSSDGFALQEFLVSRTGPSDKESAGGLINESNFAKFTGAQLSNLMTIAAQPAAADLVGKTFVCSSYTKLDSNKVDLKRRIFALSSSGVLVSSSDLQGSNIPWALNADGLHMLVDNFTGCGRFTTANVLRKTGTGNLISEVVLDLEKYIAQCVAAGFDEAGTRAVEENSTFPSVIDSKYVVDSYEFCRPVSN